jgi:hypothetical protein
MAEQFNKVTKKAALEAKVNQAGQLGTDINQFIMVDKFSEVEKIFGEFVERVKKNIDSEKDMVVSGKISDIEVKAENGFVNVYGSPHLVYQDRGVNGTKKKLYNTPHSYTDKMPPVSVFENWIKRKGINTKDNPKYGDEAAFAELSEDKQIKKAAWAMAKKVFNEGFKPRNIYSKEIPKLVEDLSKVIANFVPQYLIQNIDVKPPAKRIV